jgi:hypothetical protein
VLRFPFALWLAGFLAAGLALPSVFADFYCDDQGMVLRLEGLAPGASSGPFGLYTFVPGDPGERHEFVDHGPLPWWTSDGLRLSFFRPLSSGLFALDHALWARNPLPYHLHSIAWYLSAVIAAAWLLRHLLPEREAAAAALLFAVSPAHWMLAAWPSARHVAISGTFAIAAIALHFRAREHPGPRGLGFATGALASAAVSLASGETALGAFAYISAYEIVGRSEPIAYRLRALAPWAAVLVVYACLYRVLGYGVRGSGAYVDPIGQPGAYLALLPSRLAVFVESALLGVPSEVTTFAPRTLPILAALGGFAATIFGALLRRASASLAPEAKRTLAWLLTGAVLATLPGAAGIPGDRILFLPNLGVAAALGVVLLRSGSRAPGQTASAWPARAGVGLFALVHVVLGPLLFAVGSAQLAWSSRAALALTSKAEIPAREGVNVIGIGLSDPLLGMYLGSSLWIAARPEPRPRVVDLLTMSSHDHRITRTDEKTLEIAIVGGTMLEDAFERVVRGSDAPLRTGDVVPLDTWTVRILDDVEGRPTRFSLTFDRPVDDPSIALVVWQDGALRALEPPAIGHQVLLKHQAGPMGI